MDILCLSNGGFDGLGKVREKEMHAASKVLGFDKTTVLSDPRFQDGMDETWDPSQVSSTVAEYVEREGIEGVISFDNYGVSGHPNHVSVAMGVKLLRKEAKFKAVKMYSLESVNLLRKFIGPLDILLSASNPWCFTHFNPYLNYKGMNAHKS